MLLLLYVSLSRELKQHLVEVWAAAAVFVEGVWRIDLPGADSSFSSAVESYPLAAPGEAILYRAE
jgi:hypothetical protein